MSYCRFQNTSADLYDCVEALSNMQMFLDEDDDCDEEILSEEERQASKDMYRYCLEYIKQYKRVQQNTMDKTY